MSMDLIIVAVAVITLIVVAGAAAWRRLTQGSPDTDAESDPDIDAESEGQVSEDPEAAEPQTPQRQSPAATPATPWRTAPAPSDEAGQGFAAVNNSVVRPDIAARSTTNLWNEDTIRGYQDRWGKVQLKFVDDPPNAAAEAEALITDVIASLAATVNTQKSNLDTWRSTKGLDDTEELRMVVRRYREFLDRVLGA
jgi:hypothetical protein